MIEIYSGLDEKIRELPFNVFQVQEFKRTEKYAKVNGGSPIINPFFNESLALAEAKTHKLNSIVTKTQSLINSGFAYGGYEFSRDATAQGDWTSLIVDIDNLSFPVYIQDKNGIPVSFANKDAVLTCFRTGRTSKMSILSSDAALRSAIISATNFTELKAVIDNR